MTRVRRVAVMVVALVVIVLVLWWFTARAHAPLPASQPSVASVAPATSRTPASPSPSATVCHTSGKAFVPSTLWIERLNLSAQVIAVTEKSSNGTMAPPKSQPWQVAWLADFPKPGSAVGAVNLTAHTYHLGGALGNTLYSTNPLRKGDVIGLKDGHGNTQCYQFERLVKITAADYTSSSTAFYDPSAKSQLRIMICWDYDASSGEWDSRVVFYAKPIK